MQVTIWIDGREMLAAAGAWLVDVARENGCEIPTLCHDPRVEPYGSCGLCLVEAAHTPKLIRACSTAVFEGLNVTTHSDRVFRARQAALELLLSDHRGDCRPPCSLACPAGTDCQGYVGLVAMGQFDAAYELVKEKIPLPGSIGRICPHPCQTACRRGLVEEPVSIAAVKSFLGDYGQAQPLEIPDILVTGNRVAVVGGGPGGLSAAYFLRLRGHAVDVFEQMPQMGGMLHYGIPEYRLPKQYLAAEIDRIKQLGISFRNSVELGRDVTLETLRQSFDAVVVATGAWQSIPLGCPGEELAGVVGGIDFLRGVTLDSPEFKQQLTGKKVAVVGGGNTAMDACRTAVRLGAEEVSVIYRRTRNEMPAEDMEITEALEEGVILRELCNPMELLAENGRLAGVRLQRMELGEPDASGRRSPQPITGAEETLALDILIVAIGQKPNCKGLDMLFKTKRGTIAAGEADFTTNLEGVFAIGDATNKGADIAIAAIGEAQKASGVIDSWLKGTIKPHQTSFVVTRELTAEDVAGQPKAAQIPMRHQPPESRRQNFAEVNYGYSVEEAQREAIRCLECGCMDYFECSLYKYANEYDVHPEKYDGESHHREIATEHHYIRRNPDKCILCGLCVRTCREIVGEQALGLVGRGFDTLMAPALELPLEQSGCVSCGQCVALCPTGALVEVTAATKQVPVREDSLISACSSCSLACQQKITYKGTQVLRALPYSDQVGRALLCEKGRFGILKAGERITEPHILGKPVSMLEFSVEFSRRWEEFLKQYGNERAAVLLSDNCTNEEISVICEFAKALGIEYVAGLEDAPLIPDGRQANWEDLVQADSILLCADAVAHPVIDWQIQKAGRAGTLLCNTTDDLVFQNAHKPLAVIDTKTDCQKIRLDAKLLPLYAGSNSAGLLAQGILPCSEAELSKMHALLIFGEPDQQMLQNRALLFVQSSCSEVASQAEFVLPAQVASEKTGSMINLFGELVNQNGLPGTLVEATTVQLQKLRFE